MTKNLKVACSFVENDGAYEINFDYADNDGIAVKKGIKGDNPRKMLNELQQDITRDLIQQTKNLKQAKENDKSDKNVEKEDYINQLKQTVKELTQQNNSLKADLQILQRRADDAVNKLMQLEEKQVSTEDDEDDEEDEFIWLLKDLGFKPCFRF